jgi:hypothetical protein
MKISVTTIFASNLCFGSVIGNKDAKYKTKTITASNAMSGIIALSYCILLHFIIYSVYNFYKLREHFCNGCAP